MPSSVTNGTANSSKAGIASQNVIVGYFAA